MSERAFKWFSVFALGYCAVAVVAIVLALFTSGCGDKGPRKKSNAAPTTQGRFVVTEHGSAGDGSAHRYIFTLSDKTTGKEFVVLTGSHGGTAIAEIGTQTAEKQ